jgi:hypothetical protein
MDSRCESRGKKMIGKPYSGKLNVRFDEGELEIEPRLLRQFPTLPQSSGVGASAIAMAIRKGERGKYFDVFDQTQDCG